MHSDESKRVGILMLAVALLMTSVTPGANAQDKDSGEQSVPHKSPFLAFALSAIATGVPIALSAREDINENTAGALVAGGFLIGPGVGYMYGGAWGRAFPGIGIRFGATLVSGGLALMAAEGGSFDGAGWIIIAGAATVLVDGLVDIFSVGSYISELNAREDARHHEFSLNLSPTYDPKQQSIGLHLNMSF